MPLLNFQNIPNLMAPSGVLLVGWGGQNPFPQWAWVDRLAFQSMGPLATQAFAAALAVETQRIACSAESAYAFDTLAPTSWQEIKCASPLPIPGIVFPPTGGV